MDKPASQQDRRIPRTARAPRDRRPRPTRVAHAIKDWLVERNMAPGDRLPSKAELMARFGMAKGTIREAMRILEAQGLMETRTGPGAAVSWARSPPVAPIRCWPSWSASWAAPARST